MPVGIFTRWSILLFAAVLFSTAAPVVVRADEIKVGLIAPFSGAYSEHGRRFKEAVETYLAVNGATFGGHTVTMIYRDTGAVPQRAHQLAQELVTRDEVQYITGIAMTPEAMSVIDVANEAKVPVIVFNTGTSALLRKSPYMVRVGYTLWSVAIPMTKWALKQGKKNAAIVVADFAPGEDGIAAFTHGFTTGGGKIAGVIKVPLGTADFSSYLQRVKDLAPDCMFVFMPKGPMSIAMAKGFAERGLKSAGIDWYGTGEMEEDDLPAIGESALGTESAFIYGPDLDTPLNRSFVTELTKRYGPAGLPQMGTIEAYDGMRVLAQMIKATNGKRDAAKAMESVRGFAWESPRGPVSIDPKTRDFVQNIYIRKIVKSGDGMVARAIFTYPDVKEPWLELNPE